MQGADTTVRESKEVLAASESGAYLLHGETVEMEGRVAECIAAGFQVSGAASEEEGVAVTYAAKVVFPSVQGPSGGGGKTSANIMLRISVGRSRRELLLLSQLSPPSVEAGVICRSTKEGFIKRKVNRVDDFVLLEQSLKMAACCSRQDESR